MIKTIILSITILLLSIVGHGQSDTYKADADKEFDNGSKKLIVMRTLCLALACASGRAGVWS